LLTEHILYMAQKVWHLSCSEHVYASMISAYPSGTYLNYIVDPCLSFYLDMSLLSIKKTDSKDPIIFTSFGAPLHFILILNYA